MGVVGKSVAEALFALEVIHMSVHRGLDGGMTHELLLHLHRRTGLIKP